MISRRAAAIVLLGALCACGRSDRKVVADLHADPLYRQAQQAALSSSCANTVPLEFGRTLPVPGKDGRYQVLFYPLVISPGKSKVVTPQFRGDFAANGATDARCSKFNGGSVVYLGPGVKPGLSNADYDRAETAVYAGLPRAVQLYRNGAAGPQDQASLVSFVAAFQTAAEPGLIPYYYRLNPDFWEWLRKAAGRSLPKPAS